MLFKSFLPTRYGGKMNRWARFQKTISKKRWMERDAERNGPITIFDFQNIHDAVDAARVDESSKKGGWRISDDSVIGGYSKATFQMIRTIQDYQRVMNGQEPIDFLEDIDAAVKEQEEIYKMQQKSKKENDEQELEQEETETEELEEQETETKDQESHPSHTFFIPFVRWKGTIDTRVNTNQEDKRIQRSGFCAIRSPEFPFGGANLDGRYNGLEIMCRSDGRPYSVNLRIETFIPDDVYQCFVNIPPTIPIPPSTESEEKEKEKETSMETIGGGRFDKVVLLFQHFIVTSGGRMRATQRELDNNIKIQSIGFTLMDGVDGDFQFDLARIRAVNYDERGVIGKAD